MNALLLIIETLATNQRLLILMSDPIITLILPSLLLKTHTSESADLRFLSLKIFTDIVVQYLGEETIYNTADQSTGSTLQLNDLLVSQLFPTLPHLLQDTDPLPLFALKLLSSLLDRSTQVFG